MKKINLDKYIDMPKINTRTFCIFLLSFIILNTFIVLNIYNKNIEKKDIFRLHVVANSNSVDDQITKFKVVSKIEDYIASLNSNNKQDLIKNINEHSDEILKIANSTLEENGIYYSSKLNVGKIQYEEKQSMTLDMDEGTYDSAKLILGNGEGKNFWTLIFPNKENIESIKNYDTILPGVSKIFDNSEDSLEYINQKDTNLKEEISGDINEVSTTDDTNDDNIEYSFKCLEIFESIKDIFK